MTNVEVVRNLYDAFSRGDREALLGLLDPDVVWEQNEGFPNGGVHVGAVTVLDDVLARFRTEWSRWAVEIDEYLEAKDAVIVVGSYHGTHAVTGSAMRAAFAHIYRVRGGRVVRFQQFTDTLQVAKAAARWDTT